MPWHIGKSDECPASKPVAVIKDDDGDVAGCHTSEQAARRQMAALYAQEDDSKSMETIHLKAAVAPTTDQGVFEAVISTQAVDREKDVVVAAAMVHALKQWKRPIPLAWEHSTKAEDIFGHIEPMTVREEDGEVIAQGQVDLETKVGQEAWRSFKNGTMGFSFGYLIPDGGAKAREGGGRYITALDVYEITATRTPMNNDTRVLSAKTTEALRKRADQTERKLQDDIVETAAEDLPDPEPPVEEPPEWAKALGELEQALTEKIDTLTAQVEKQVTKSANQPSDPELASLRKQADETALKVLSGGEHLSKPPKKVEEPKPDLPSLKDIRQKSRDVMLAVLSDMPIQEEEGQNGEKPF